METLTEMLDQVYLNNSVRHLLFAAVAFFGVFVTMAFLRRVIAAKQERWRDLNNPWVELPAMLLAKTGQYIRIIVGLYLAEKILVLPPKVDRIFDVIIVVGIAIQVAMWRRPRCALFLHRHGLRRMGHDPRDAPVRRARVPRAGRASGACSRCSRSTTSGSTSPRWSRASASAASRSRSRCRRSSAICFGSMSIALDKPFTSATALRIDDIEGTVEQIGIKSTRLRSVNGEQIILSNADVLKSRVRNMGRMPERRVLLPAETRVRHDGRRSRKVSDLVETVVSAQPARVSSLPAGRARRVRARVRGGLLHRRTSATSRSRARWTRSTARILESFAARTSCSPIRPSGS